VRVGSQIVIDQWHLSSATEEYTADLVLGGTYPLLVEYFESAYSARVTVWWERLGNAP
jgi:hypothetical protein